MSLAPRSHLRVWLHARRRVISREKMQQGRHLPPELRTKFGVSVERNQEKGKYLGLYVGLSLGSKGSIG